MRFYVLKSMGRVAYIAHPIYPTPRTIGIPYWTQSVEDARHFTSREHASDYASRHNLPDNVTIAPYVIPFADEQDHA